MKVLSMNSFFPPITCKIVKKKKSLTDNLQESKGPLQSCLYEDILEAAVISFIF